MLAALQIAGAAMNEHAIWPYVERSRDRLCRLSDQVWATPETRYTSGPAW